MRHAREWSAEIRSVSLQERSFLLPFYFYVLADKFLISCPVSIRIRNRVGLGLWSRHNTASGPNIYTATGCGQRHTEKHLGFCLISQLAPVWDGGGAVSWRSCKQTILTRSTMEAELTALDTAIVEAEWLRELLMDLPVVEKPVPAILMNCDNQTVIAKVNNSKDNAKSSRHVKRRLKSVRKLRNSGVITVTYIQTDKNLADPFTKGLSRNVIDIASREMGMRPIDVTP